MLLSPALIVLPWAWFTRIEKVRAILIRAFIAVLIVPFLIEGLVALFDSICTKGSFFQPYGDCGIVPDSLANLIPGAPLLLLVPASAAAIYCAYLEIQRFLRQE
ncbi:MAG: hypothetical protein KAS85_05115 [Rhodobacteraceae bacterium]|nr:hypothetical protein [Paracoccaceae bacterium]